jgi:hypothetical protein
MLHRSLVRALMYFDLFQYPLTAEECRKCCGVKASKEEVSDALGDLVAWGWVLNHQGFWGFGDLLASVHRREKGNELALSKMPQAHRSARKIAAFPFVEAVMVSGSLSKNYMEAGSDIDFFIVTKPGRLWVARTLLILYKKVFLLNSHAHFCVNYFVDTDHLTIEDKNIFTATEVNFLIPMVNPDLYHRFREANIWADELLPNFGLMDAGDAGQKRLGWMRRMSEKALSGTWGEWLDGHCMRLTFSRWKRKFKNMPSQQFEVAMRTRTYVSKHHPGNFQSLVLQRLSQKIHEFEQLNQVSLDLGSIHAPATRP